MTKQERERSYFIEPGQLHNSFPHEYFKDRGGDISSSIYNAGPSEEGARFVGLLGDWNSAETTLQPQGKPFYRGQTLLLQGSSEDHPQSPPDVYSFRSASPHGAPEGFDGVRRFENNVSLRLTESKDQADLTTPHIYIVPAEEQRNWNGSLFDKQPCYPFNRSSPRNHEIVPPPSPRSTFPHPFSTKRHQGFIQSNVNDAEPEELPIVAVTLLYGLWIGAESCYKYSYKYQVSIHTHFLIDSSIVF